MTLLTALFFIFVLVAEIFNTSGSINKGSSMAEPNLAPCFHLPSGAKFIPKVCIAGYKVYNATHCQECEPGWALEFPNQCSACQRCQSCYSYPPYNAKIIQYCQPDRLQVCGCKEGFTFDPVTEYCKVIEQLSTTSPYSTLESTVPPSATTPVGENGSSSEITIPLVPIITSIPHENKTDDIPLLASISGNAVQLIIIVGLVAYIICNKKSIKDKRRQDQKKKRRQVQQNHQDRNVEMNDRESDVLLVEGAGDRGQRGGCVTGASSDSRVAEVRNKHFCYEMYPNRPAGIALVFYDDGNRDCRSDLIMAKDTLMAVDYTCKDYGATNPEFVLRTISSEINNLRGNPVCSVVVAFITHGTKGAIICRDERSISIKSLEKQFFVPHLIGIPVILLLDVCRGGGASRGCQLRPVQGNGGMSSNAALNNPGNSTFTSTGTDNKIPEGSDILKVFASTQGNQSFRDEGTDDDVPDESWFFKALNSVLLKYAAEESFNSMMSRVTSLVAQNVGQETDKDGKVIRENVKQLIERNATSRRNLFFPPYFRRLEAAGEGIPWADD